jgi:IS5 family transposase
VREQQQRQRGPKVYSLHAPEVECIGKGKAHRPYEFGVKVSVATTISRAKGGQFVTHVKALPGNPYDGHTLATVIPDMEALVGSTIERILADKGYRGHNAPPDHKFRVFISGQKRGVTPKIKRELRRRAAVEPVIGHLKAEHRMGRNYLWLRQGERGQPCPPPHPLAQPVATPNAHRSHRRASDCDSLNPEFFTDDGVAFACFSLA